MITREIVSIVNFIFTVTSGNFHIESAGTRGRISISLDSLNASISYSGRKNLMKIIRILSTEKHGLSDLKAAVV